MPAGGNAAGHEHHRGAVVALQFVAQQQPLRAGMAHRQVDRDLAAHGNGPRWLIGGNTAFGICGRSSVCVHETHGLIRQSGGKRPSSFAELAFVACHRCRHSRTIFRRTLKSPQDLAPTRSLARPRAAPASKGLSLRRSRWWRHGASTDRPLSIASSGWSDSMPTNHDSRPAKPRSHASRAGIIRPCACPPLVSRWQPPCCCRPVRRLLPPPPSPLRQPTPRLPPRQTPPPRSPKPGSRNRARPTKSIRWRHGPRPMAAIG